MERVFRFSNAAKRDPAVDAYFDRQLPILSAFAQPWFEYMRACGRDVRELMHDHYPVACAGDVAFCYVSVFKAHANIGFWQGAVLSDATGLLIGTGKMMRHVKIAPDKPINEAALRALIDTAYADAKARS